MQDSDYRKRSANLHERDRVLREGLVPGSVASHYQGSDDFLDDFVHAKSRISSPRRRGRSLDQNPRRRKKKVQHLKIRTNMPRGKDKWLVEGEWVDLARFI
jgi:hypothetical protein